MPKTQFAPETMRMTSNALLSRVLHNIDRQNNNALFAVQNPANGEHIADVPDMGADDTKHAIENAHLAQSSWANLTSKDRSDILKRWHDLIMAHEAELGDILTLEQGKPLAEARREVTFGAGYVEWFAEEAKRAYGDVIPSATGTRRNIVIKQPVGIVGAITPWNFPSGMITRKAAPALAAGCVIVLKPSEETPLSALALACLAEDAGFPEGVFQVITSNNAAEIGDVLTSDPRVRKISFTGSTRVGKLLMQQSADGLKRLSLELGGNAPFIVFDDADIEAAVSGAIAAKFRNAGQTCVSANRLLLHESIHDDFIAKFVRAIKSMNIGDGFSPSCDMGPMINAPAKQKVLRLIDEAVSKGATLETTQNETGNFMYPTVLSGVTADMSIAQSEIFGPVAPIFKFSSDAEAIRLSNATPYGLAAYIWTRDVSRIWYVSEQLEFGMVGLNETAISSPGTPFGGVKESGVGREGSKYGLDDYLNIKSIALGGIH